MEQNFQQNSPRTSHPLRWPENIEKEINKIKSKLLHFPIKEIARCLEHNNIIFKCAGIRALSDRKEHDYVSCLLRLVDKKVNKLIRLESVIALGKIQNEEAIEPLKKLLYYEPFEIRTAAIISLAKIGSSAVVPAFIQTLEDKDPRIRIATAKAFTILGDKRNIIHLEGKNLDPDENVRAFAKKCISMLRQGDIHLRKEPLLTQYNKPAQPSEINYSAGSTSSPIKDSILSEPQKPVAPKEKFVHGFQDNTQNVPPELIRSQSGSDGVVIDGIAPSSHISQLSSNVDLSNIHLDEPLLSTPVEHTFRNDFIKEEKHIYNTGMKDISADIKTKLDFVQPDKELAKKQKPKITSSTDYIIESNHYDTEYDEEIDTISVEKYEEKTLQDQTEVLEHEQYKPVSLHVSDDQEMVSVDADELEDSSELIESKYYDIDEDEELDDLYEEEKVQLGDANDIFESKYYDLKEDDEDLDDEIDLEEDNEDLDEEMELEEETELIEEPEESVHDQITFSVEPVEQDLLQKLQVEEMEELRVDEVVSPIEPLEELIDENEPLSESVEEVIIEDLHIVEPVVSLSESGLEEIEEIQEPVVEEIKSRIVDSYQDLITMEETPEIFEQSLVEKPQMQETENLKETYEDYDLILEDEPDEVISEKVVLPQFTATETETEVDLDSAYLSAKDLGEDKIKIESFGMVAQIEPEAEQKSDSDQLQSVNKLVASDKEKELIEMLLSKNLKDRKTAVKELNTAQTKEALEALAHAATTDISWVRKEAIKSMIGLPHDEKVTYLITFLSDSKWYIREEATKALGQIGSKRAIDPILVLLNDENKWVQETALRALAAIDMDGTISHIESQLESYNANVKSAAKHLLHSHNKVV